MIRQALTCGTERNGRNGHAWKETGNPRGYSLARDNHRSRQITSS